MSNHSLEPWEVGEEHESMAELWASGRHVATLESTYLLVGEVSPGVNLARAAACVNACKDFSTKLLEAEDTQLALIAAPDPFAPEIKEIPTEILESETTNQLLQELLTALATVDGPSPQAEILKTWLNKICLTREPGRPPEYKRAKRFCVDEIERKHAENRIVLWDWANGSVLLSNGQSRPMMAYERINPRITDAKTGEKISHVVSYGMRSQNLIRYAVENGVLQQIEDSSRFATIGERREVRIETSAPQKGRNAENHT